LIMNAIKLRLREVLCDKCKTSVIAKKKKEIRKGRSAVTLLNMKINKNREMKL
jgi:hypothetical protein